MDDITYHQRSNVEAIFFALHQRFGGTLRARTWFSQFRELVLKCAVSKRQTGCEGLRLMISGAKHGQIYSRYRLLQKCVCN